MEKTKNGQRWVPNAETLLENMAEGFSRRILAYGDDLMCVENHFAVGAEGKLHSHPHTQISYIVSGVFDFTVDGETRTVKPGDSLFVPGDVPHGLVCVEQGIVLDVFTPMREDFV